MKTVAATLLALAVMFGTLCAAPAATEEKRVALVIGNSKYLHALALPNPANDARLMATTLRNAGFEVIEGIDLDKAGMSKAVDEFSEVSFDAQVALVYYSGHGMQVEGHNFLIPVDAELTSPAHLKSRTVQVEDLLAALPADPAIGIIILDACRDNPLSRSFASALPATRSTAVGTGLAAVQASSVGTGTGGTLIAYATDPGSVALDGKGANSPYTTALAKYIATPGIELQSALTKVRGEVTEETLGKQRPWHNASLGREVFLGGQPKQEPVETLTLGKSTAEEEKIGSSDTSASDVEKIVWEEASKRNTVAHYEAYLARYPGGAFADLARLNIEQLNGAPVVALAVPADPARSTNAEQPPSVADPEKAAGTELTEAAMNLDRQARIDIQERLMALDYDLDDADGNFGPQTRRAIGVWQQDAELPRTTWLTGAQLTRLKLASEPVMEAFRAERAVEAARQQERARAAEITRQQDRKAATARRQAEAAAERKRQERATAASRAKQAQRRQDAATGKSRTATAEPAKPKAKWKTCPGGKSVLVGKACPASSGWGGY